MTTGRDGTIDADRRSAELGDAVGRAEARQGVVPVRWTKRMKEGFLDHLAATCHVRASAAAIGVAPVSVYGLRRRDAAFAQGWVEALAQGYVMLETLLVGHALAGDNDVSITNGAPEIGPVDRDLALRMLTVRDQRAAGKAYRGGPPLRRATAAETNAAILTKLAALSAARERRARAGAAARQERDGDQDGHA